MLKTAKSKKGRIRVSSDSRAGHGRSEIDGSEMDDIKVDCNEVKVDEIGKKVQKSSKSKMTVRSSDFLTLELS